MLHSKDKSHTSIFCADGFQSPQSHKELFNLRHSQLRNIIERIFGVAKRRFLVFAQGTRFNPDKQSRVLLAFAAIFNFLVIHDPENPDFNIHPGQEQDPVWRNFDSATGLAADDVGDEGESPGPSLSRGG
jgi:hypothetical protein